MSAAVAAGRRAGSVAWVTINSGRDDEVLDSLAGRSEGHQTVTSPGASTTIRLAARKVYLRGNAKGLQKQGFSAATAAPLANRWISWVPTDRGYGYLAGGLTINSTLAELKLTGTPHTLGVRRVSGHRVVAIRGAWGKHATATLYVSLEGPPLPMEEVITGGGVRTVTTYRHWGIAVMTPAPSPVIPIATLRRVPGDSV
jgi:energy-converting hydrogenase Eha subunit B